MRGGLLRRRAAPGDPGKGVLVCEYLHLWQITESGLASRGTMARACERRGPSTSCLLRAASLSPLLI